MFYYVEEDERYFDDAEEAVDFCIDDDYHEDDDYFEEWVNEIYDGIEIAGTFYYPYTILDNCDTSALYDLQREYCEQQNDNDRDEAIAELSNHAKPGTVVYVQGYTIRVVENIPSDEEEVFPEEPVCQDKNMEEKDIMSLFQKIGG